MGERRKFPPPVHDLRKSTGTTKLEYDDTNFMPFSHETIVSCVFMQYPHSPEGCCIKKNTNCMIIFCATPNLLSIY